MKCHPQPCQPLPTPAGYPSEPLPGASDPITACGGIQTEYHTSGVDLWGNPWIATADRTPTAEASVSRQPQTLVWDFDD